MGNVRLGCHEREEHSTAWIFPFASEFCRRGFVMGRVMSLVCMRLNASVNTAVQYPVVRASSVPMIHGGVMIAPATIDRGSGFSSAAPFRGAGNKKQHDAEQYRQTDGMKPEAGT
jgi:hypothetical protein